MCRRVGSPNADVTATTAAEKSPSFSTGSVTGRLDTGPSVGCATTRIVPIRIVVIRRWSGLGHSDDRHHDFPTDRCRLWVTRAGRATRQRDLPGYGEVSVARDALVSTIAAGQLERAALGDDERTARRIERAAPIDPQVLHVDRACRQDQIVQAVTD